MDFLVYIYKNNKQMLHTIRHNFRNLITGIKNFWKWRRAIYYDRDWDHYYIYEILKNKLKHQGEYMIKHGMTETATEKGMQILECADLIDKVQHEYFIDIALAGLSSQQWSDDMFEEGIKKHEEAKTKLYKTIQDNIETWWD